jgi:peptide/nickel transport system permease protein
LLAPLIAPYDPAAQPDIVFGKSLPPSFAHPFGTDPFSRDVLSRVIYGARLSLMIGVLATIVSLTFGVAYGAVAGYAGGALDAVMMRVLDAFLSIPRLLLLIGVLVAWPRYSIGALVLFLGLTGWFGLSRIVRGQVLALKHAEFVTAAQALGASRRRILWRHLLPNLVSPIVVAATLGVAHVIVLEAGLSYLGIGVPPPSASWGNIIQDGADQVATLWWMSLFPGLFMVLTVMTLNILAEALSEAHERR